MANITNFLNKIKTAVHGKDVRGAIHDAIKQVYDDASVEHDNANMEVKLARGTHNTLNDRLDNVDEIQAQTNAQLSQTASVVGGVNNYDVNKYIKSHGVTTGLQMIIDDVCEKGQGLVLLNGIYEIDRPLTVERTNKNLATSIKFYGNATIRKSGNFVGDRLVTFKIGYHDEDCITFDGITFDGVDRTVNGIDNYNESLAYNENPSSINDGNQSKYVTFNQCTFINCYVGARLGSLSYTFNSCLFHSNIYGVKLNCSANANTFVGCSVRRNTVGIDIRQLNESVGTIANGFYNCTIESNKNIGIASFNDRDTKVIGCYFENNGWNVDAAHPNYNNKRCHIYYGSFGGVGRHYIDSFFNTSDVTIGGKQFSGIIANRVSCEFDLVMDNSFINTDLSNIKISANQNYESRFRLKDNKLYYSPKLSSEIICESDNYNTMLNAIDFNRTHTTTITDISDLTKVKLFSFEVNQVSQAICELLICMTGNSSGGAPTSQGFIKTNILISHKYTQTFAIVDDIRFIGPVDGKSDSIKSNNIFTNDTSTLIIERETTNKFGVYVTNIKNTSITDWGKYVKINVDISVNVTGSYRSKNANHILIS